MTNKETGGPAFPINVDSEMTCLGMTLRDYFAAKAMQGMFASAEEAIKPNEVGGVAVICYAVADAMLKAREA